MYYGRVLLAAVCLFTWVYAEETTNDQSEGQDRRQERQLMSRSTLISILLDSTTTTVPFSCNNLPSPSEAACAGRRRRRSPAKTSAVLRASPEPSAPELTSSQESQTGAVTSDATGRLFFTVLTTSFTTFTLTSTVTDFRTTVSYSLACTVAGMTLLPNCATVPDVAVCRSAGGGEARYDCRGASNGDCVVVC